MRVRIKGKFLHQLDSCLFNNEISWKLFLISYFVLSSSHNQFINCHASQWLTRMPYFLLKKCFDMSVYMHALKILRSFSFPLTKSSQNYSGPLRPSVLQLWHLTVKKTEIKRALHLVHCSFSNILLLFPILITNYNNLWLSGGNIL